MCGIIYLRSKDGRLASNRVIKRYRQQKARGKDGYGYVEIDGDKQLKRTEKEADIEKEINTSLATDILFHHRHPTSTDNLAELNHPIVVKTKSRVFFVVHNGVISNAQSLRTEHEKLGWKYNTIAKTKEVTQIGKTIYSSKWEEKFNDSEALAVDIVRYIIGDQNFLEAQGSIAFVCLETNKKGSRLFLHWGRNTMSPLKKEESDQIFCLKSEGGGQDVQPHYLYSYNFKTKQETSTPLTIGSWSSGLSGGHDYPSKTSGYLPSGYSAPEKENVKDVLASVKNLADRLDDLELEVLELNDALNWYKEHGFPIEAEITASDKKALEDERDQVEAQLALQIGDGRG